LVTDATTGAELGEFYLDIFQRDGKYSHQCVYPIRGSYRSWAARQTPAVINIGNMSKPTATEPSLLRWGEVQTFFHEFGHVCHAILTNTDQSVHSWTWPVVPAPGGVEMDFLEVPSMMFQNWIYHRSVVDRLSKHHKTGERLPEEKVKKLIALRDFNLGLKEQRYLAMALFDVIAHSSAPPYNYGGKTDLEVNDLFDAIMKDVGHRDGIPDTNYVCSWYHMIQGYDVGYYGYLWAEVFAQDINAMFMPEGESGPMNFDLGAKFRRYVLEPGASKPAQEMLTDFLGRPPNEEAYLKHYKLVS